MYMKLLPKLAEWNEPRDSARPIRRPLTRIRLRRNGNADDARVAVRAMNGKELAGRPLRVEAATSERGPVIQSQCGASLQVESGRSGASGRVIQWPTNQGNLRRRVNRQLQIGRRRFIQLDRIAGLGRQVDRIAKASANLTKGTRRGWQLPRQVLASSSRTRQKEDPTSMAHIEPHADEESRIETK